MRSRIFRYLLLTARIHQLGSNSCNTIRDFSVSIESTGAPSEKFLSYVSSAKQGVDRSFPHTLRNRPSPAPALPGATSHSPRPVPAVAPSSPFHHWTVSTSSLSKACAAADLFSKNRRRFALEVSRLSGRARDCIWRGTRVARGSRSWASPYCGQRRRTVIVARG